MSTIEMTTVNDQSDKLRSIAAEAVETVFKLSEYKYDLEGIMYFPSEQRINLTRNDSGEIMTDRVVVNVYMASGTRATNLISYMAHVRLWSVQEIANDTTDKVTFSRLTENGEFPATVDEVLSTCAR